MAIEKIQIEKKSVLPPGIIVPWMGGYFGNSSNGGYTSIEDSSIATANNFLSKYGWFVCDGTTKNYSDSYFFNDSGRYVPNLTDDRFLMGGTSVGVIGGSNNLRDHTHTHTLSGDSHAHTINHTHSAGTALSDGNHRHGIYWNSGVDHHDGLGGSSVTYGILYNGNQGLATYVQYGGAHTHSVSVPAYSGSSGGSGVAISGTIGSGSVAISTENRPKYLTCLYIIKIR